MGIYVIILAFFPFFPLSCASRVEVLKEVFLCCEREQLLIRGLKALGYFHAKAYRQSPWGTGDTIF